jgi:NosL
MRWLILAAAGLVALGCSSVQPLRIDAGERCFRCGRVIEDSKLAAEIIDEGGHALKFRTASCMAKYVAEHGQHDWRGIWVTDYGTGKFVKVNKASFARITVNPNTNERDYAAFASAEAAAEKAKEAGGAPLEWDAVLAGVQQP